MARRLPRARRRGVRRRRVLSLFRRERGGRVDWLVVGLGNPGDRYARTRHNIGFEVANELARRWDLSRAKKKYAGLYTDGRTGPGGPRVGVLLPQTYMNEAGRSVGPARGALGVDLEHVLAIHDEIDLPFGTVEARLGGGLAGHNGLKSLKSELGSADFRRVRVGVGRPDSTDPEIVSAHVLGRFAEDRDEVARLVDAAADEAERAPARSTDRLTQDQPSSGSDRPLVDPASAADPHWVSPPGFDPAVDATIESTPEAPGMARRAVEALAPATRHRRAARRAAAGLRGGHEQHQALGLRRPDPAARLGAPQRAEGRGRRRRLRVRGRSPVEPSGRRRGRTRPPDPRRARRPLGRRAATRAPRVWFELSPRPVSRAAQAG